MGHITPQRGEASRVHTMTEIWVTTHYITIDSTSKDFTVKCICGSFNKEYSSRDEAHAFAHLHIAGINVDLLELALAGKVGHA